jgi:predicted O-methyltransferase YrrM
MKTIEQYSELKNTLSPPCVGEVEFESLESFKDICGKANPSSILELGFNRGMSAIMWLEASNSTLHSIDIKTKDQVVDSLKYISKTYTYRFTYTSLDHNLLTDYAYAFKDKYDLVFIDGDHSYESILRDTKNTLMYNPKYIAYDDYFHPQHATDTKNVINYFNLEIMEEYKTTCGHVLVKNIYYT